MFIAELFNGAPKHVPAPEQTYVEDSGPQLVVLYPGRFQPFHLGHSDVFNTLQSKFGRGNVYISTSNKTEEGRSPFNYSDKLVFMTAAGVPVDRVIENTSPYKLPPNFDPANTILVVAVGAPDADRLRPGSYKKDGQPGYYQKFESVDKCTTADKHGYVIVAAERKKLVTIGGKQYDASHGTEVRNLWNAIRNKPQQRAEFIVQLFGRNDPEVGRVLDKIDLSEAAGEVALPVDSISPIHGGINESAEDAFAPSERVFNQVQQDRHPLKDYLTFEDYDMLMDEFADAQSAVKNDAELDAYLEKFESGVKSAAIPQVIAELVEEFVHGRHGKYGTEVPRRNQVLLDDLNKAFSQIWMDFKPDRFVRTLARHMAMASIAAIHAEESDDDLYEEDDMFAPSKAQKIARGLQKYAEELQRDMNAAHASWQRDKSWYGVEQEKIKFILFLADNFNNRSKVPYTLNYIARVLNGGSEVEYFKKHAIWDADDYLKETMGRGFAELFDEFQGRLDEEDDMFADSKRVKVTKAIIDDLEYIADQMIYEPEAFLEGRGWEDADVSIDEVQEAGSVFENLANEFKTKGLDGGLAQLFHIFNHTQNQVAEWVTDETIDALSNDYEVDMSRFNLEEEDDMFSAPGKVATSVKHNVSRKLAVVNQANRAKDQELQKIVEIAKAVYGRPYSTGTIGGGKVYRLSIPARLNHDYRYVKLDSVSVDDKTILNQTKGKFFDLLKQQGLDASRVDIKYHIGSGLYVSVRIKMKSEVA
jgi:cytidyltransferase-like protein